MKLFLYGWIAIGLPVLMAVSLAHGGERGIDLRFRSGMAAVNAALALPEGEARAAKLDEAIAAFHSILIERPELVRVRLELARAFFLSGRDSLAAKHFEQVLAGDIPEAVAANIHRFLAAIRSRKRWWVRFGMALAPDTNVGAASGEQLILLDTPFGRLPVTLDRPRRKESGIGLSVWSGGEYQYPFSPSWRLRAGGAFSRREYHGAEFDRTTLSGYAGPRWLTDPQTEVSLLLDVQRHWLGGTVYFSEFSPRLEAARRINRRLTASGRLFRYERRHDHNEDMDGPVVGLSAGLSWNVMPTVKVDLAAGLGRERAKAKNHRNRSRWVSAGVSWALGQGFTVSGAVAVRKTGHEGGWAPFTLDNAPRNDTTRSLRLSVQNRGLTLWGFSPLVSAVRERRDSNAQLHDYERTSGELRFVRMF